MESAVIVRVTLPDALDRLRLRCVRDAALGVPAHVTLLYPFVEAAALSTKIRRTIESIASGHPSFSFALSGPFQWPDTVYAAVVPDEALLAIHRELAMAFSRLSDLRSARVRAHPARDDRGEPVRRRSFGPR